MMMNQKVIIRKTSKEMHLCLRVGVVREGVMKVMLVGADLDPGQLLEDRGVGVRKGGVVGVDIGGMEEAAEVVEEGEEGVKLEVEVEVEVEVAGVWAMA